jgi:glycosyltransferase involved in cell wall biosynthesis
MSGSQDVLRIVFAYRYGVLGGVSAQLLNRFPWLSSQFDVHVLYEQDYGMAQRFSPGVAQVTETQEEMETAIGHLDPDILFVIDSPAFIEAWRGAGAPGRLVLEVHTTTANREYLKDLDASTGISAFLTVSEYMRRTLAEAGIDQIAPIHVVPNCLDSRWFQEPDVMTVVERPLMWVGKLDSHKRWRAATDIMDDVLASETQASPLFVGGYTAPLGEIQSFLRRIHCSPRLKGTTWWPYVDHRRMPSLYASVAASSGGLLMTTRNESFGMAAAEAVLMGCPVVAPRVGALPEILPDEALYEPDDWAAVRTKVRRMFSDDTWRADLAEATRARVRRAVHPRRALERFNDAVDAIV